MRLKSMIFLVIFIAIIGLPFLVQAASGHIFNGVPIPVLGGSGGVDKKSAAVDEYAESLPKPALSGTGAQYAVDINVMRNHMNVLKQKGQSAKQLCSSCHTNRAEFCDRCHSYVGVSPSFDY